MMLTLPQLIACMPYSGERAPISLECLNTAMSEFHIDSLLRQAMFLAQVAHESGSLRYTLELADGMDYDVTSAAGRNGQRAGGGGRGAGGEMAQVAGTWTMTVNGPQGAMTSTMTVTQTADAIDGNMISELGTAAIAEGRVNGRTVTWSAGFQMNGERTTVNFEAEVDGNRMTGRLRAGEAGTMAFTAERKP